MSHDAHAQLIYGFDIQIPPGSNIWEEVSVFENEHGIEQLLFSDERWNGEAILILALVWAMGSPGLETVDMEDLLFNAQINWKQNELDILKFLDKHNVTYTPPGSYHDLQGRLYLIGWCG